MMEEQYIRQLIERFFDGGTTLAEEQVLYGYFAREDIAEDLQPLRDMFLSLAGMAIKPEELRESKPVKKRFGWTRLMKAAAGLILPIVIGSLLWSMDNANYCEAYFYSHHVTDQTEVMAEVENVLASLDSDEDALMEEQLRTIFNVAD